MSLISLEKTHLAFGHYHLLDSANLVLEPGERVGLIGRNGSGKSSLLKVIAGVAELDSGIVRRAPTARLAFVSQEPVLDSRLRVFEAVAEGIGAVSNLLLDYHKVSHDLAAPDADIAALLEKMQTLQSELEANDGWNIKSRVDGVLSRLDLSPDQPVGALSGGWKKRVALARALVAQPDVLLLDEPTNHLDVGAIEWLENLLQAHAGSVLFVTHDRRFLDRVATRIVELDRGQLVSFPGNFTAYQQRKQEMLAAEALSREKFDHLLAQEEVWIRKGVEARRTRNEGRVRRLESLRCERAARRERQGTVNFALEASKRSGKLVAELQQVNKSFDGKVVIQGFSTRIQRGDRIGLIGPNGAGKSTLLKLILGELAPDRGTVQQGTKLAVAYFDQFREQLDPEVTLIDTISPGGEFIEIGGERKHVVSYLGDFLFAPERARSLVKSLSGGERNRLLLARLFAQPANVLVLDEPTNDLDIETLEMLEMLLLGFNGTLFLVSHDRTFLDNVVTQIIAFEGGGVLREYVGGYEDWLRCRAQPDEIVVTKSVPSSKPVKLKLTVKQKLNYKENRELDALPGEIEVLEQTQREIGEKLADAELYRRAPEEASALQARYADIETQLFDLLARWETLDAKTG